MTVGPGPHWPPPGSERRSSYFAAGVAPVFAHFPGSPNSQTLWAAITATTAKARTLKKDALWDSMVDRQMLTMNRHSLH